MLSSINALKGLLTFFKLNVIQLPCKIDRCSCWRRGKMLTFKEHHHCRGSGRSWPLKVLALKPRLLYHIYCFSSFNFLWSPLPQISLFLHLPPFFVSHQWRWVTMVPKLPILSSNMDHSMVSPVFLLTQVSSS